MKNQFAFAFFALTLLAGSAKAAPVALSNARKFELLRIVSESAAVKPFQVLGESKIADPTPTPVFGTDLNIDCDDRPRSYGRDLAEDYCKLTLYKSYGWHADPVLVLKVVGYIRADKIQTGMVEVRDSVLTVSEPPSKDLVVTAVTVGTPLRTGLE